MVKTIGKWVKRIFNELYIVIILHLFCNLLLISLLRFVNYKREAMVFYSQLLLVVISNTLIFLNYKNIWAPIEIATFSVMTVWISILMLEIWAMTNDGYTIALFLLIYNNKLSKSNMDIIDNMIQNTKKNDRINSLVKLKLLKLGSTGNQVTSTGFIVLKIIAAIKTIFVLGKD